LFLQFKEPSCTSGEKPFVIYAVPPLQRHKQKPREADHANASLSRKSLAVIGGYSLIAGRPAFDPEYSSCA
jgi:hypothetical protein